MKGFDNVLRIREVAEVQGFVRGAFNQLLVFPGFALRSLQKELAFRSFHELKHAITYNVLFVGLIH